MSSSRLLEHLPALCNIVRRVALEAGELTLEYFDESGYQGADAKSDGSPVTIADRKAEALIYKALKDTLPDVPIIGEEAASDGKLPDVSDKGYFWLVDPIDGTRQFVDGSGEYTVNIGLIKDGLPVLGVVYAPVPGELYAAAGEGTAIRWLEDSDKEKPIKVRQPPRQGLTVMGSVSRPGGKRMENYLGQFKIEKVIKRGSSLKFCAVAAGKADLYPLFGESCEWDTAAAHAILLGAGGVITDVRGNPVTYGGARPGFLNPELIAYTPYIDAREES